LRRYGNPLFAHLRTIRAFRSLLIPGCTPDEFDLLGAIVCWVEKGNAPNAVIATGKAFPGLTRPLCPYPKHAQYRGQGNTEDASNFEFRRRRGGADKIVTALSAVRWSRESNYCCTREGSFFRGSKVLCLQVNNELPAVLSGETAGGYQ
jgi:hypothetical protein